MGLLVWVLAKDLLEPLMRSFENHLADKLRVVKQSYCVVQQLEKVINIWFIENAGKVGMG